ncbi:MAG TPA: hypothetical protein VEF04_01700 [Blastocatellia bacterium]|nr:hypothetical protein [Blastocatellia bacterium]
MFRLTPYPSSDVESAPAPKTAKANAGLATRCKRKFLRFFPKGYADPKYYDWERGYKWNAHLAWQQELSKPKFRTLLKAEKYAEIASTAVWIESKTNLLFSFEKMALRDAVKSTAGARILAEGLYKFLHGPGSTEKRFENWVEAVESLPRKQTRVLTWPLVTVFAFIAQPEHHFFLKPNVTRRAAMEYGYDFMYRSRPNWDTYSDLLKFAEKVRRDTKDLKPKDMIDIQSFLWVQGSNEYTP